ncbi:hypothetical protein HNR44_000886 [Geomicrobium halophilum]|uniref:Uncharacterized protein n=1 Tax=Geomicrobium halophilum TaxID=549000 RepID=A0A841PJ91_9BACL|nr:hypothetical protein [Geomicrobium halophilum]
MQPLGDSPEPVSISVKYPENLKADHFRSVFLFTTSYNQASPRQHYKYVLDDVRAGVRSVSEGEVK